MDELTIKMSSQIDQLQKLTSCQDLEKNIQVLNKINKLLTLSVLGYSPSPCIILVGKVDKAAYLGGILFFF